MNFTELNKFFINYLAHIPLQVGYFFYIKKKDGAINNIFLYQDFFQYENFFFYCDPKPLWRAAEKKTSSTVVKNNAMKIK